jgi:hypothetical protein
MFREHYTAGGTTDFVITQKQPDKIYTFEMSNQLFSGNWIGKFVEVTPKETLLIFTEEINFRYPWFYILSFFMMSLKKMQTTYMIDLEKAVLHDYKDNY